MSQALPVPARHNGRGSLRRADVVRRLCRLDVVVEDGLSWSKGVRVRTPSGASAVVQAGRLSLSEIHALLADLELSWSDFEAMR
jgi:hypothetical protein